MTDTYEPTTLEAYLTDSVESPPDAADPEDLQPSGDELDDGQSSPDDEEVAPPVDPEQPEDVEDAPATEAPAEPPAPDPNALWDSEDNPYRKAALELETLKQRAMEVQAEQAAKAERDRLIEAGKRIVEVDEEDLGPLMGDFIDEIRETAAEPYLSQINTLHHGMTALVAAIQTLPAAQQETIKAVAKEFRELGTTSDEIERAFTVSQRERAAANVRESKLMEQVKNLQAELKKTKTQASGKNRAESAVPVGASTGDPTSWNDLLGNGPL